MKAGWASQQKRDRKAEQKLEHNCQRRVDAAKCERIPKRGIGEEIDIVLDADEAAHMGRFSR